MTKSKLQKLEQVDLKAAQAVIAEMAKPRGEALAAQLNPTGIQPCEYKVLIRLDPVEDTVGAKGLIYAPDAHKERDQQAMTFATLVAVGGNAFEDWKDPVPQPGDRVIVNKYAGLPAKAGDIENLYRLAHDKEIVAILE